jgi:tRNA A-37 threonylcarbamoyl transferase component Bud32
MVQGSCLFLRGRRKFFIVAGGGKCRDTVQCQAVRDLILFRAVQQAIENAEANLSWMKDSYEVNITLNFYYLTHR